MSEQLSQTMSEDRSATKKALQVSNLQVEFDTHGGVVQAVRGVSFEVNRSETLAIVGESGCGKSVTMMSVMGLIPMPPGRIVAGSAKLNGREMLGLSAAALNKIRGAEIGMIFQDPMSALNPTMKVGEQIAETLMIHRGLSHREGVRKAVELLDRTKMPEAQKRAQQYPFEFSGGMLQRAVITEPRFVVCDEPISALDVSVQAQVVNLLGELQEKMGLTRMAYT